MISYLIELGIIHSLLIVAYWFFLKKESQYGKMRVYLVASILLAVIVPFLNLPSLFTSLLTKTKTEPEVFAVMLQPVNFSGLNESSSNEINFLYVGYALISLWFLCGFISSLVHLIHLERKSEYHKIEDIYVRKVENLPGTFTFFNWIFVNKNIENEGEEYLPIIKHEQAHARLGHSYDLLLVEFFKVIAWWLPGTWFIRKEIKKIHEYQADTYALKSYSIDRYSSILISSTLKSNGLSLASSFHDGLILKRLKAMKQNAKQIKSWKLSLLGVFTALLIITFACNEELDKELKEISANAYQTAEMPESTQKILEELKSQQPGQEFKYVEVIVEDDAQHALGEKLKEMDIDHRLIAAVDVHKEEGIVGILLKEGQALDYASEKTVQEGDVFTIVEQQPTYEGGMEAFYRYVGNSMDYPQPARESGIEGRVYVQFVVEKDGSVSEVTAVKGIGGGCDEEAVRVIENATAFIPGTQRGKPVRVRMVMPVIFKMESGKPIEESTAPAGQKIEEVVVVGKAGISADKLKVNASYGAGEWSGTVYDSNGEPLPGVNIVASGTPSGTVSDMGGKFALKAGPENDLILSFVGFETVKLTNTSK